jgi:hypothetical protein
MKKVIWWATLIVLLCAFLLSTVHTIRIHYIQLGQLLQLQADIFHDPEEKWQGIEIERLPVLIFAKNLETGHRIFALVSGISICSASAITAFLCVSYFLERRRGHNRGVNSDAQ